MGASLEIIKNWWARAKRLTVRARPRELKFLGQKSWVMRPFTIWGRPNVHIGSRTSIYSNSLIHAIRRYEGQDFDPTIYIGDDVYVGGYAYLVAMQEIRIENGCVLSEHVYITDQNHGFDPQGGLIMKQALQSKGPVKIGPNCFLGYRTAVMPGVSLGEWCIVGANSVVTRSFPAYSMIAGAPACLIKTYSFELGKWVAPSLHGTGAEN